MTTFEHRAELVELVAEAIKAERERLMGWKVGPVTETDRAYARAAIQTVEAMQ